MERVKQSYTNYTVKHENDAGSPNQKKIKKQIDALRKKLGMDKKPIKLRSKSGMGTISHLGMPESVDEGKYEVYFDVGSPGLMSQTVNAKNAKEAAKMVARKLKGGAKLIRKVVKEGTCFME